MEPAVMTAIQPRSPSDPCYLSPRSFRGYRIGSRAAQTTQARSKLIFLSVTYDEVVWGICEVCNVHGLFTRSNRMTNGACMHWSANATGNFYTPHPALKVEPAAKMPRNHHSIAYSNRQAFAFFPYIHTFQRAACSCEDTISTVTAQARNRRGHLEELNLPTLRRRASAYGVYEAMTRCNRKRVL